MLQVSQLPPRGAVCLAILCLDFPSVCRVLPAHWTRTCSLPACNYLGLLGAHAWPGCPGQGLAPPGVGPALAPPHWPACWASAPIPTEATARNLSSHGRRRFLNAGLLRPPCVASPGAVQTRLARGRRTGTGRSGAGDGGLAPHAVQAAAAAAAGGHRGAAVDLPGQVLQGGGRERGRVHRLGAAQWQPAGQVRLAGAQELGDGVGVLVDGPAGDALGWGGRERWVLSPPTSRRRIGVHHPGFRSCLLVPLPFILERGKVKFTSDSDLER